MDGIQPFAGPHRQTPQAPAEPAVFAPGPYSSQGALHHPPQKTAADYLLAIRRRAWLVLSIAVFVSVAGTLLVLRMPAIYRATAEITIEPPRYDRGLTSIIRADALVQTSPEETEKYVPDKVALLQSKALAELVVRDPSLTGGQPPNPLDDAAAEVVKNLYTRNKAGTHYYTVAFEGRNPAKAAKTLDLLLHIFREKVRVESGDAMDESKRHAGQTLQKLDGDLHAIQAEIYKLTRASTVIAPGGTNVTKERLQAVNQALLMERVKYGDIQRQLRIEASRPVANPRLEGHGARVAKLEEDRHMLVQRYSHQRKNIRGDDPSLWYILDKIKQIDGELARVRQKQEEVAGGDDSELILASAREEIQDLETQQKQILDEMKDAHPTFDRYQDLVSQREMKQRQIAETSQKLSEFESLAKTQKEPVTIVAPPVEPILPERPKKALYIAVVVAFGLALGIAMASLLEHVDHSVKVPEHLTVGLALPLLGVVPRIRRTAKVDRGGHLWTPGVPDSPAADAYRNIRASLLGVAGARGPIVTLLVTSAKVAEGKSTTALNLAATCARAGERTLLVDVDLRRPSLADVFPHEQGHVGLVDVLRGELPWERVVVPSDLPNLDFIPTGDARQVPIEILGSLELRQLLLSLSQRHYDRVILDGPAVLGLADCRMLGRIVDASLLVVRSGRQGLPPHRRAKEMLEQSHVRIAGIVFNAITDGLEDWSSFAPGLPSSSWAESSDITRSLGADAARLTRDPARP